MTHLMEPSWKSNSHISSLIPIDFGGRHRQICGVALQQCHLLRPPDVVVIPVANSFLVPCHLADLAVLCHEVDDAVMTTRLTVESYRLDILGSEAETLLMSCGLNAAVRESCSNVLR